VKLTFACMYRIDRTINAACSARVVNRDGSSEDPPTPATSCTHHPVKPPSDRRPKTAKPEVGRRRLPLRHRADRKCRGDDTNMAAAAALERRLVANARERRRMTMLNEAFDQLRAAVPFIASGRKLSKYDTLQLAQSYINALVDLLTQ